MSGCNDMNMHRPYSHRPVDWINEDGERQCLRCERKLTGSGASLRHVDEAVPPAVLNPDEAHIVQRAVEIVEQALAEMWTDQLCTDRDRAQVAVQALLRRGLVGVTRKRRRASTTA